MMRLNFSRAEEEFLKAIELDKTPLSRSNLAALYQIRGLLPEALNQLQKINENKEKSWMYYYGLNQEQFTLDLYRQFYQVYRGLFQQTKILGEWGFKEKISRGLHVLSYGLKSEYYKILYRIMAFKEGQSQLAGGSALRGSLTLAAAAEGFPPLSDKYYGKAFALEVFPQASPWYDLEIGRENRDISRLQRASETFDPLWEVEALEESFREMALLMQAGKSTKRDDLILRIYERNPGGLLQYGLRLPLSLKMSGSELSPGAKRKIRRLLKDSGFSLRSDNRGIEGRFLTLRINMGDAFAYTLSDNEGSVLISGSEILQGGHSLEDWVLSFRSGVFFP
jgi:tetratricopeptide (TPR) repeat protein